MRKITYLAAMFIIMLQSSFSQENYSRIKILNPSQETLNLLADEGIDLRCGAEHAQNTLTLDVSAHDKNLLQQLGISYSIEINDLETFQRVRAENDLPNALMQLEFEKARTLTQRDMQLAQRGSISETLIESYLQYGELNEKDWLTPTEFNLGSMGGCLTLSEMEAELDDMRTYSVNNGLDIVSVKQDASPTGQTTWGNPSSSITNNGLTYSGIGTTNWDPSTIYYVRITGNESSTTEGTKPQMLFTSMIHAREVSALMNNIYFMWHIIENYNTDPAIKNLVDNNELYFVPVVNPDGLRWNEHLNSSGGAMQRKNLRPNTGGNTNTSSNRGVDLNRNYDYFWGTAGTGSSATTTSDSYRGPSAASEPETQIMVDFILNRNFKTAIWNHTWANSIPHPYGGNPSFVSGREDEMHKWHEDMTKYNRYVSGATIFTPANGIADDWMVGGSMDANGSTGSGQNILATTPEHGSEGFWPSPSSIIPIAKRSMRISLMGAYYGGKYAKFHDLTQSDINSTSATLDFAIERLGQTASDFTLTVTPISSNITNITSPSTQTGMAILEQRNVSASITLDPSIQPDDKIEYKIQLSNDDGIFYEANMDKYYQPSILFSHDADTDGLTGWTNSGWSNSTADAYSGSNSLRTGNTAPYANNSTKTLTTSSSYDLSNSSEVLIQFYSKWDIERNFDLVEFQASTNGSTWITLNGKYSKPKSTSDTNGHDAKGASDESFQDNNSSGHIYDGDQMDKWVMEEITINDTENSAIFESPTVQFRFRMRTDSGNVFENYSANGEGFFFDDFKIVSLTIPCVTSVPTGLSTSSILDSSADLIWDDIPSATFDIRYRETGASVWNEVTDISLETFTLNGLTELTEYEVQVRSKCTSSTSSYSSSLVFTTLEEITCTGTIINTFPYAETFDSGIGDWTQNSGDDGDWSQTSGATPSGTTGPSDDAIGGGSYLFTEASTNGLGSNATVILTSPCYNLANLTDANFSFYYHMFGDNLGTLLLEITADDGNNWTTIFSQTGGSEDLWKLENISLSSYNGQVVKFRFTGTTGSTYSSDIAIDQISISDLPIGYCDSAALNDTDQLGIQNVQFNTLDNTSAIAVYSDFTSSPYTTVSKNTTYLVTITPQYNVATTNAVGYGVWIDFNRDGDFDDSGEEVYSQSPVTGGNPVSGNITIPSTVPNGNTVMRVAMSFNALPSSCGDFDYGEVEDYAITLFNGLLYQSNSWTPNAPSELTGSEDIMLLDGTYSTASDIAVNDITVASGATFNVSKENAVTVNGNITNNGNFVMQSDSDEFSSLLLTGSATGDLQYNRFVNSNTNRNDLISPPFSGESFVDFISNNSNIVSNPGETLYLFGPFDKTSSDYLIYSNTEISTLDAGKGYRTASTDNNTFTFTGSPTTGNLNVPIQKTGSAFEIWNLIGNPYPSYIRLEDFLTANIDQLDSSSAAVYGYDADNSNGSYWTIYNFAYAAANPNTLIAPGQGFFVSAKDGGGTVSFTPSMQTSGNSDDFISGRNNNLPEFGKIVLSSTEKNSSTDLYFTSNASLGLDIGYDASHFDGAPSDFAIYSELVNDNTGKDMAIQAINFSDVNNSTIIPLGVNVSEGEQVTISLTDSNIDVNIYLEDVVTNTFTLLNTSNYTFTPSSSISNTGRFYLRFDNQTLSNSESNLDALQVYSDYNNDQIVIKGQLATKSQVRLFDIQGREILNRMLNSNILVNTISTSNLSPGVYLVKISDNASSISQKIIVR